MAGGRGAKSRKEREARSGRERVSVCVCMRKGRGRMIKEGKGKDDQGRDPKGWMRKIKIPPPKKKKTQMTYNDEQER